MITTVTSKNSYDIHQIDIKAAYFDTKLSEDIYMYLSKREEIEKKYYCKLNKALYKLRQARRMWNNTLNITLLNLKFTIFL
jgi:hypothetical protein